MCSFKKLFSLLLVLLLCCACGAQVPYEYHNDVGLRISLLQGDRYKAILLLELEVQNNTPITTVEFEDGIIDMTPAAEVEDKPQGPAGSSLSYSTTLEQSEPVVRLTLESTLSLTGREAKLLIPSVTINGRRYEGPWELSTHLKVDDASQEYTLDPAAAGPLTDIEVQACPYTVRVSTPGATEPLAGREVFITLRSGSTPRSSGDSFSSDPTHPRFFHYNSPIAYDQLVSITIDGMEYPLVPQQ